jgi:predicted MPP superfamily phosphohydrolase
VANGTEMNSGPGSSLSLVDLNPKVPDDKESGGDPWGKASIQLSCAAPFILQAFFATNPLAPTDMPSVPLSFELATAAVKLLLLAANAHCFWFLHRRTGRKQSAMGRWAALAGMVVGFMLLGSSELFRWDQALLDVESGPTVWHLLSSVWTFGLFGSYCVALLFQLWNRLRPLPSAPVRQGSRTMSRREIVSGLAKASIGAPFAAAGYGTFIGRDKFELREVEFAFPNLPPSLDGLRIAQLTDLHAGPYLGLKDVDRVVAMANETRPHLAVVTGDLITRVGDPLEQTIDRLAALKADAGIWGCMGNHEDFARSKGFTESYGRQRGVEFLRQSQQSLRFGDGTLNLSGVDYQWQTRPYLVHAEDLIEPGTLNLLLSHNPDVFPKAAKLGYDLVLGGHTHGGQVTVEIVEQWVNAGHFFTPYVAGEYHIGNAALYVSRGIGTVNLPMRIGALPEVTLVRLKRA